MDNLYSSFYLYKKYEIIGDELIDLGITSVDGEGTQEPVMKEECDPACGCPEPIYRWVQTEDTVCVGESAGMKYSLVLSDSSVVTGECDETSAITSGEVATQYSGTVVSAVISDCVASISDRTFINCSGLTSCTIPNSVTNIGQGVFYRCRGLSSVTIPNSVTSIGGSAFMGCYALTSMNIPTGVTTIESSTFNSCGNLTNINLPSGVTSIGYRAFYYCSGLTSVTIPSGVTSIGDSAFYKCSGLTSITCLAATPPTLVPYRGLYENFLYTNDCPIYVPCESVSAYQAAEGWSDYASRIEGIPPCGQPTPTIEYRWTQSGTTCIGYDKYQNNIKEQSTDGGTTWTVVIPEEYSASTLIESQSTDCGYVPPTPTIDGKFKLTLNDSSTVTAECDASSAITNNEVSAYSASVTSAEIGECVTAIGDYAFKNCSGITNIYIPNSVTSIGGWAFYGCSGLTSITIPNSVTRIKYGAFSACTALASCTIGSGVTSIGGSAFDSCSSLTSIDIPDSVTSIDSQAFYGCSSLTSVTIGNSVTSIGSVAFRNCSSLTSIVIPDSVTSIGNYTFYDCSGLTSVTVLATTPPSLGNNVFYNTNNCPIYVSCESVSAYQAAEGWSDYASRIQALPTPGDSTGKYTYYYGNRKEKAICNEISAITGNHSSSTANKLEIGNCVTSIGAGVFSGLTVATSITISSTITSIGDNAFKDCPQMSIIIVNGITPPTLGNNVFDGTNNCPIQVPCGYASTYRAASGWSAYASRII